MRPWLMIMLFLLGAPLVAAADPYYNSSEPGGDGSDPAVLMAEDFERPGAAGGNWYGENCDVANRNGGINARTNGWCGTIYGEPITPPGAFVCGPGVGVRSNCVGSHGTNGKNMADHNFKRPVTEFHVRYYQKFLSGYSFGAEKILTFNEGAGSGGIKWGNLHANCGGHGTPASLQWQPVGGNFSTCFTIMKISPSVWYAIEIAMKLSTTTTSNDGYMRFYVDDCGADGTACTGAPTLRYTQANMSFNRTSATQKVGALWWESWSNPGSTGVSYIDQILVREGAGMIGFMGASGPPPPPPPPVDMDGDGVPDVDDACPTVVGPASNNGCPIPPPPPPPADTDGDGIIDTLDRCPTVPGVLPDGCPPPPPPPPPVTGLRIVEATADRVVIEALSTDCPNGLSTSTKGSTASVPRRTVVCKR